MKWNEYKFLIVILTFLGMFSMCKSVAPVAYKLSPEESRIIMVGNDQRTTLTLNKTHLAIATEEISSEIEARKRAVGLGAEYAQLLSVSTSSVSEHYQYGPYSTVTSTTTIYRFWKKK